MNSFSLGRKAPVSNRKSNIMLSFHVPYKVMNVFSVIFREKHWENGSKYVQLILTAYSVLVLNDFLTKSIYLSLKISEFFRQLGTL